MQKKVVFTAPDAARIAKVVRAVEGGDRKGKGLDFGFRGVGEEGSSVRLVTFTGAWPIGGTKTCTVKDSTEELEVVNYFHQIGADCGTRDAAVAQVDENWILLVAKCG
jgi:hypothetical protein